MAISVIGVDFQTASLQAREQVALTPGQAARVLQAVAAERIFAEALVLSTCNRTEFYFAARPERPGDVPHLLAHVAEAKALASAPDASLFYRHDGPGAVRHLFRVASSLESQIVGEHEIAGQVKDAYRLACEARTAGFFLHKAMHWCFRTAKRVLTETDLGTGTASVSQAAVDLARQVFARLSGKTVLLVGAGQTAELACRALLRAGATNLVVANRTLGNAQELADRFLQGSPEGTDPQEGGPEPGEGPVRCPALVQILERCSLRPAPAQEPPIALRARAIALEEVPSVIAEADLLICSTGAAEPVLKADDLRGALAGIRHSLLMIDLSVPRNIDPALEHLPNVFLYNIDGLEALVAANLRRRQQEVPRASAIVEDEVERFGQWLASLGVVPTIKLLAQRIEELQRAEIARYGKRFPSSQRGELQEFARTLCAKILHDPISFLRQIDGSAGEPADPSAVNILRQIFNLDAPEDDL